MKTEQVKIGNFEIFTSGDLDGYGYQSLTDAISCFIHFSKGKKYQNCLEWCSGPGYFGFAALYQQLAKNITLLDIYESNETVCNETIKHNNISNARFILSDNFKNIDCQEKFDLIIGNPPHFNFLLDCVDNDHEHRKFADIDWKIHQDFFENVNNYLTDDGEIMLMENSQGSNIKTFEQMIDNNNLKIIDYCTSVQFPNELWYLHITKA